MSFYKTIRSENQIQLKEKGSTFIAYLFPVKSEDDFKKRLNELKKEFPDASHHCYAFRLEKDGNAARSSDDGEPSGTAGKPIMNQLLSADLSYCALVVVRYFGGTKLGTGGLIKAYKDAAKAVIQIADVTEEKIKVTYSICFPFELSGEIMRILSKNHIEILHKEAAEKLTFYISVPMENKEIVLANFSNLENIEIHSENKN